MVTLARQPNEQIMLHCVHKSYFKNRKFAVLVVETMSPKKQLNRFLNSIFHYIGSFISFV